MKPSRADVHVPTCSVKWSAWECVVCSSLCLLLCCTPWMGVSRAHESHFHPSRFLTPATREDGEGSVSEPDAESSQTDQDVVELLEYFYRLFSDVCHQCPTSSQSQTLARAEDIYTLLHGFRTAPATAEDLDRVLSASRMHYAGLCNEYRVIKLRWDSHGWRSLAVAAPIELARGVTRHVLVELENGTSQRVTVHAPALAAGRVCPAVAAIPPGEARSFLVPLRVDRETIRDWPLDFDVEGASSSPGSVQVAVQVRPPATLQGRLMDAETGRFTPGRVTVRCSDGILRHAQQLADNATLSEKPVVFRPALMKLPFFYSLLRGICG